MTNKIFPYLIGSLSLITLVIFSSFALTNKEFDSINIGKQTWMQKNLDVTQFSNGDKLLIVTTKEQWEEASSKGVPACCAYDFNNQNKINYGLLYNWFAVNDSRGLAPKGWKIPKSVDWNQLETFLGPDKAALRIKAKIGWLDEGYGNNESGFSGLPGGTISASGKFYTKGDYGYWWTSSQADEKTASAIYATSDSDKLSKRKISKKYGFSIRCIKSK